MTPFASRASLAKDGKESIPKATTQYPLEIANDFAKETTFFSIKSFKNEDWYIKKKQLRTTEVNIIMKENAATNLTPNPK